MAPESIKVVDRAVRIGRIQFSLKCRAGDLMASYIEAFGVWERHISFFLSQRLRPGDCFIDVGANAGYYSILADRLVGAEGRVLAVEPHPVLAGLAAANLSDNGCRSVQLERTALAASPGRGTLHLQEADSGTSFLSRDGDGTVPIETLESLCRSCDARPRAIKIDVEGLDLDVLAGGLGILAACRPIVVTEFSPGLVARSEIRMQQLFADLSRLGYRPGFFVGSDGYAVVPTTFDILERIAGNWVADGVGSHLDLLLSPRPSAPL